MKELLEIYTEFFKMGAVTFGGGYSMLPILRRTCVEKHKWITEAEVMDFYAISQGLPGIISVNVSVFIGYHLRKLKGGIAAALGCVSPCIVVISMIAISESTPGPIGINMATYVGYHVAGLFGGMIATLGVVCPAVIIVTLVSKSLEKFSNNKQVDYIFYGLRPAVTGLIAAAGYSVVRVALMNQAAFSEGHSLLALFSWNKLIYCAIVFFAIKKLKKHPVLYILVSAAAGLILGF